MLRKLAILLVSMFLLSSVFAGCGQKPVSESTTTAAPAGTTAKQTEEDTKEHEPYEVDIYSFSTGTFTYTVGMALAEIINEQSTWLKANSVESPGSTPNELMMYDNPDMRKSTLYYGIGLEAWRGTGAFEGKQNTRSKLAFSIGLVLNGLLTADPNIKTLDDLVGKTVALRSPVASINAYWKAMFDLTTPGVKFENLTFNECVEANLSGRIGGWFCGAFSVAADLKQWRGNPATTEFLARTSTVNFINLDRDADIAVRTEKGGPFEDFYTSVFPVPPQALDPRQTEAWDIAGCNVCFLADQDMPEDVVYEIARIMGENRQKLMEYHPQCEFITPETMAIYTYPQEFHPGSLRYFEEKGVEPIHLNDFMELNANW